MGKHAVSDKQARTQKRKALIGAGIGTLIEYYDYCLFSIFMPIFAPVFFPGATVYDSLVKGYYILLLTMLARPLGGLLFGHIGDTIGRSTALLASMYGIAISSVIIGITPSYASIGVAATIIIALSKAVQIFCFGGEYNGAGIYVVEHARSQKESYIASILAATTCGGALLASISGVIVTSPNMPSWSWRLAFILGGIVGIFGVYYRKNLVESPAFQRRDTRSKDDVSRLLKHFPKELTAGFFIGGLSTVPITSQLLFLNPVLMALGAVTHQQLMLLQTYVSLTGIIFILLAGKLADKKTPGTVMQMASLSLIVCSLLCFELFATQKLIYVILSATILITINEFFFGPANAYLKNLFPVQYRYRGSSFSFGLGLSVIGGITPIAENFLYQATGVLAAAALWPMLVGLGAYWSLRNICYNMKSNKPMTGLEWTQL